MRKSLVIIPARGGSKRLPGKNLRLLGNKPLVSHTIDTAKRGFDGKILVTSDSEEIILAAKKQLGGSSNVVFDLRPASLATDHSKVIDTVLHYMDVAKVLFDEEPFEQIWLALPTCPLRSLEDCVYAQELLTENIDSIISTTDYEFPPSLGLLEGAEGLLTGYDYRHPFAAGDSRSQDQARVLRPNGALYGSWWSSLAKNRNFYRGRVRGYYMPRERSVDIDTELDFKVAELLLEERRQTSFEKLNTMDGSDE